MSIPQFTDMESSTFRRLDVKAPLIVFAALFITAVAICGTLESRSLGIASEEARVLNQENVAGPVDTELLADCDRSGERLSNDAATAGRCRERAAAQ